MLKDSLIKDEEGSSGLYYSLLIVFIIAFSVIFTFFIASLENYKIADETWYILLSFSVSPLAIIASILLFTYLKGESLLQACGWQRCEVKYCWIALIAFVAVFLGLGNVNTVFVEFLSKKFGYNATEIVLPEFSIVNYLLVILTVCLLPAVSEEIAMRGIVLRGIKTGNVILSATVGGLLFSLFHMTPMQTPYQFAVGFIFSLIAIKSGSTIPTTIAHFFNNFAIITIEYFCPNLFVNLGAWMIAIIVPAIICLGLVVAKLIMDGSNKEQAKKDGLKNFFIGAIAGVFICTFMWTMSFLGL